MLTGAEKVYISEFVDNNWRNSNATTKNRFNTTEWRTQWYQPHHIRLNYQPYISPLVCGREKLLLLLCDITEFWQTNQPKKKRKNTTKQVKRINARASFNIRYNSNGYGHIESGESDYIRYVVLYVIGGGSRRRFDKRMVRGTRIQRWTCGSPHTGKQQSKHAPKTRMQHKKIEKRKKYLYIRGRHSFPASVMLCSQLWSPNGHTWKLKLNNTTNI